VDTFCDGIEDALGADRADEALSEGETETIVSLVEQLPNFELHPLPQ
jgi:hypothetical protein